MFLLRVSSEVRPTEDENKVLESITNLFDIDKYEVVERPPYRELVAESKSIASLFKFYEVLRQERILDTARKVMFNGRTEEEIHFKLHKQSAYAGKISFITYDNESPMGPIKVTIRSDNIDEIIDWLAPKTSRGRPLWEKPVPRV